MLLFLTLCQACCLVCPEFLFLSQGTGVFPPEEEAPRRHRGRGPRHSLVHVFAQQTFPEPFLVRGALPGKGHRPCSLALGSWGSHVCRGDCEWVSPELLEGRGEDWDAGRGVGPRLFPTRIEVQASSPNGDFPSQDYISLFPLDDMQPSKLMRLLSSNEDDANILSSPGECVGRARVLPPLLGTQACPSPSAGSPAAGVLAGWSERAGVCPFWPRLAGRCCFAPPRGTTGCCGPLPKG